MLGVQFEPAMSRGVGGGAVPATVEEISGKTLVVQKQHRFRVAMHSRSTVRAPPVGVGSIGSAPTQCLR